MRPLLSIVVVASCVAISCGMDGGAPRTGEGTTAEINLPTVPLPANTHGQWSETRFWNKGRTDGPSFWSKAKIDGQKITLESGEESKDSGSWTLFGGYGVVEGQGTQANPFVVHMLVERSLGGDYHEAPVATGEVAKLKVSMVDDLLLIDFPGGSMKLSPPKPSKVNPFACATDDDCWTSCKYGAVNKYWYQDNVDPKSECKDGCASKGSDARCEDGECVTYLRGKRAEHCTKRKVEEVR